MDTGMGSKGVPQVCSDGQVCAMSGFAGVPSCDVHVGRSRKRTYVYMYLYICIYIYISYMIPT
jgi:hypothetical protein